MCELYNFFQKLCNSYALKCIDLCPMKIYTGILILDYVLNGSMWSKIFC
jgi:hypothetical protein